VGGQVGGEVGGEGGVGAIAEQSIPQHFRTLQNIPGQQQQLRLPLSIRTAEQKKF